MRQNTVTVVGAGLAGSEAAWQCAKRGISVDLYEMRPVQMTAAHTTPNFAELVCSNSFGSTTPHSASGILKKELTQLDAFIISEAFEHKVPAGASLAVDREKFSQSVTARLQQNPLITIHREELKKIPEQSITIVASGPLTTPALAAQLAQWAGDKSLYFYDAISPIVSFDGLNLDKMYFASRYDKGDADFLNIPLSKEEYLAFVMDLLQAEVVLPHDFEEGKYFESCLPIETIASRGPMTLAFGPMKPVGLNDPKTGKRAFAVIQLRAENRDRTAYNLVGFQTKMKYPEQMRVFRKIPGLENAEFLRLGSMHRNTFLDSPRVLEPTLQMKKRNTLLVAGQLTGTEGYLESSATGFLAGLNAARLIAGETPVTLPPETMLGALIGYITDASRENFQPINSNFGILPALDPASRDRQERNQRHEARALASMEGWLSGSKFPSIFPATSERYTHLS